jgi:enoyl-CoA hydratase/3-hydroxyacyl-CoA dehydrogenase
VADPVRLEVEDGIATIRLDRPPMNALDAAVQEGLRAVSAEAGARRDVRAVVLYGGPKVFAAGADIKEMSAMSYQDMVERSALLQSAFTAVAQIPKPVIAAVTGYALGGGCELALCADLRVAGDNAKLGQPEILLGIIPGAGGTQRLPRVIGLEPAIGVMLEGRQLAADDALELGALDELCSAESLIARARAIATEIADGARPRRRSLRLDDRLPALQTAEQVVARARAASTRRFRKQPHAAACLDAILAGIEQGAEAGLLRERALFEALLKSDSARALIHVFFAERAAKKLPGVTNAGVEPLRIQRALVLGGGTMGSGIATALLGAGIEVVLSEASEELAKGASERVRANIERNVQRERMTRDQADQTLARLSARAGWEGAGEVEIVIEAVSEQVDLKQRLFADLARATSAQTILASNTSTIGIDRLAEASGAPERVLGMHFFSPAQVMKLVELVRTSRTSIRTLAGALALCRRLGKTPVTVESCTGFLVNRIFMPYGQATGFLIDRGIDPYRIDGVLSDFGMPMGPCRTSDLAGIDVGLAAGGILDAAYPDRAYRSPLRRLLAEAGRLGEKSGKGHYVYERGNAVEDPELGGFVLRARELAGDPEPIEVDDEELLFMTLFGVVNEACRTIEEGIVIRPSDIDVASILGMGFPAYRGGLLWWADGIGARRVFDGLSGWHDRFGFGLFRPSEHLSRAARDSRPLLEKSA